LHERQQERCFSEKMRKETASRLITPYFSEVLAQRRASLGRPSFQALEARGFILRGCCFRRRYLQITVKLAYIRLNTPMTCPPRATCPGLTFILASRLFHRECVRANCGRDATVQAIWKRTSQHIDNSNRQARAFFIGKANFLGTVRKETGASRKGSNLYF
jgi:hypothetical protein